MKRLIAILAFLFVAIPVSAEPIGSVLITVLNVQPDGYLPLDGQWYYSEDYPELFEYFDTNYPDVVFYSDSVSPEGYYFYLPNYGAKFIVGGGQGSLDLVDFLNDTLPTFTKAGTNYTTFLDAGVESVTLTTNQIPSHSHNFIEDGIGVFTPDFGTNGLTAATGIHNISRDTINRDLRTTGAAGGTGSMRLSISSTGGGLAHENRPPFRTVYYWIKAEPGEVGEYMQPDYIETIEITDSQGNAHNAAFDYSMSAGDVMVSLLLLILVIVILWDKARREIRGGNDSRG